MLTCAQFRCRIVNRYKLLKGKTIECISLIGIAVGKSVFAPEAAGIMQILAQSQHGMGENDTQREYMLAAWARMCEILQQDFIPYLPVVMPNVFASVMLEAKVRFLESGDSSNNLDGGASCWAVVPVAEGKRIGIKTSTLKEKATACEMLKIYVAQLGPGFAPYTEEALTTCIGLLEFVFEEKVRMCAASTMAHLLSSAKSHPELAPKVALMWQRVAEPLIKASNNETDHDVLSWQIEAIKDCIKQVADIPGCITPGLLGMVCTAVATWLDDYEGRYHKRLAAGQDDDYDDEADDKVRIEANCVNSRALPRCPGRDKVHRPPSP